MKIINIKESLRNIDRATGYEHSLLSLYESAKLTEDDKKKLVKYLDGPTNADDIGKFINNCSNGSGPVAEDFDPDDIDGLDATTDTYTLIKHKSIPDTDGFQTEYAWYKASDGTNVFVFGDMDVYKPEDGYFDHVEEDDNAAEEWFSNYQTFEDDEDIDIWTNESLEDGPLTEAKEFDSSEMEAQIKNKVSEVINSQLGYEDDFINDYVFVDTTPLEDGRIKIEVRAELGYDEMFDLAQELDKVIKIFDDNAYFDNETTGIISAYIDPNAPKGDLDYEVFEKACSLFQNASMEELTDRYNNWLIPNRSNWNEYTTQSIYQIVDDRIMDLEAENSSISEVLNEAVAQIGEVDDGEIISIVDAFKKAFELGMFKKLDAIGRENAQTFDISSVDKDRIIAYMDKQSDFNREDNMDSGIHSAEFVSNDLDIEVFDDFVRVYRLPQNESLDEGIFDTLKGVAAEAGSRLSNSKLGQSKLGQKVKDFAQGAAARAKEYTAQSDAKGAYVSQALNAKSEADMNKLIMDLNKNKTMDPKTKDAVKRAIRDKALLLQKQGKYKGNIPFADGVDKNSTKQTTGDAQAAIDKAAADKQARSDRAKQAAAARKANAQAAKSNATASTAPAPADNPQDIQQQITDLSNQRRDIDQQIRDLQQAKREAASNKNTDQNIGTAAGADEISESLKENAGDNNLEQFEDELRKLLENNAIFHDIWYSSEDDAIHIYIENGDWKHEHLYVDCIIKDFLISKGFKPHLEQNSEPSDQDTYSSEHIFTVTKNDTAEKIILSEDIVGEEDGCPVTTADHCCDNYEPIDELKDKQPLREMTNLEKVLAAFNKSNDKDEEPIDESFETSQRYYVYDDSDKVVSDAFEHFDDAKEFADSNNYKTVKIHKYFRDDNGKLCPDGDPKEVEESLTEETNLEKILRVFGEKEFEENLTEDINDLKVPAPYDKYYDISVDNDNASDYGFEVGEYIQDGYESEGEPKFKALLDVKSEFENILDGEHANPVLGDDNKLYYTVGRKLFELSISEIEERLNNVNEDDIFDYEENKNETYDDLNNSDDLI